MNNKLLSLIKEDEGFRDFPYDDANGQRVKAPIGKITIGYGYNVEAGMDKELAEIVLNYFIDKIEKDLLSKISFYKDLNEPLKAVLINISFNVGMNGLMKFKKTLQYLSEGKYEKAAYELLDSSAARQLSRRYSRLSKMIVTGRWPDELT